MKDLFEQILKYLPHYLTEFGAVFSGPKSFIATKLGNDAGDAFGEALLFLGISLTLVLLMYVPLLPAGKDFWSFAIPYYVSYVIEIPLAAMAIRAAWWIVGGRAPARPFFITYAYYVGVASVLIGAFDLVASGSFKTLDPKLYQEYSNASQSSQDWLQSNTDLVHRYAESYVTLTAALIEVLGTLFIVIWGLIGWGAYRQLNGLSKLRSLAALIISWFLFLPVVLISRFIDVMELG
jgi:hypothetical protein